MKCYISLVMWVGNWNMIYPFVHLVGKLRYNDTYNFKCIIIISLIAVLTSSSSYIYTESCKFLPLAHSGPASSVHLPVCPSIPPSFPFYSPQYSIDIVHIRWGFYVYFLGSLGTLKFYASWTRLAEGFHPLDGIFLNSQWYLIRPGIKVKWPGMQLKSFGLIALKCAATR